MESVMRKIIALLSALLLTLGVLVACGNNEEERIEPPAEVDEVVDYEEEEIEEEDESEEVDEPEEREDRVSPTRGLWENGVYTSEYLGLRFAPPGEWSPATDEEIAATMGLGMDVMDAFTDIEMNEELWDELDVDTFHEMMASNIFTGASVQIIFENLGLAGIVMTEITFIQMMQEELTSMGIESSAPSGTTRIGNYDWHSLRTEVEVDIPDFGTTMIYSNQFINLHRGFVRIIGITYLDTSESMEEILAMFIGLDDPIPEHEGLGELELLPELVGTWAWDEDSSYTYVFNADGTGTRGYSFLNEDFEWGVIGDDHLILDMGLIGVESWTFTIRDDVLRIDSRQVHGMSFSYIRQ